VSRNSSPIHIRSAIYTDSSVSSVNDRKWLWMSLDDDPWRNVAQTVEVA
jgi:hypothetical protein